jgi:ferredoxin
MIDRADGPHPHLAVVDAAACVACGICVGSCPVNAIALGDRPADALWSEVRELAQPESTVVFVCERHWFHGDLDRTESRVVAVPCVGMVHPDLIGEVIDGDARAGVVGCPPGDCANREGNAILAERLGRWRRPRLRRRYADAGITADWIPPDRLGTALRAPGATAGWASELPMTATTVRSAAPLAALVAFTALVTVWVTSFRFDPAGGDTASITVALDHRAGVPLVGHPGFDPAPTGLAPQLVVEVDGAVVFDETFDLVNADAPDTALAWERIEVDPGTHALRATLVDGPDARFVLFDDLVAVAAGESVVLDYRDVPVVDAADAGRDLFTRTALGTTAGCRICHSLDEGRVLVGPSLAGVATRAATAVPGLSAEQYLRQSITDPDAFIVDGFPSGQMLPGFEQSLTPVEIENLVSFLLTLEEDR